MTRSKYKPIYENQNISEKIWDRSTTIIKDSVNKIYNIYNGKIFIPIKINELMIGHKFGEFAQTRKPCVFKNKNTHKKK